MKKKLFMITLLLLLSAFAFAAQGCGSEAKSAQDSSSLTTSTPETEILDDILKNISKASSMLKSCQSNISYLFIQDPDILESKTLRVGKLFYLKENNRSKLRIRFDQIQQDDFETEEYTEDYYFDGVWLTKVDYKLEQVDLYQQAHEDAPIDVFELISHNFPLIGFSGAETLQKDFDISLEDPVVSDPNKPIQLHLLVKKDSEYQDEYTKINFWIDPHTYLPSRVMAYSTQGDIYDIRFLDQKMNKNFKNAVFKVETPAHFSKNIQALETGSPKKGK